MTQGAVIFAMGDDITYVDMAVWNAHRIQRYLDIPVSLITDQAVDHTVFDQVIRVDTQPDSARRYFTDYKKYLRWQNHNRCDALELSPYQRTLLLDADYVICSDSLKPILDHTADIMCFRTAYDVVTGRDLVDLNHFGTHRMPMWWATVVVFDKTPLARFVFDAWRMVRDNWQHYCNIYQIPDPLFRNDYAMTIALGIVSGHTLKIDSIPWKLATILPGTEFALNSAPWSEFQIFYRDDHDRCRTQNVFDNTDCHVMAKSQLEKIIAHAA
jgi:hypothetical protein